MKLRSAVSRRVVVIMRIRMRVVRMLIRVWMLMRVRRQGWVVQLIRRKDRKFRGSSRRRWMSVSDRARRRGRNVLGLILLRLLLLRIAPVCRSFGPRTRQCR